MHTYVIHKLIDIHTYLILFTYIHCKVTIYLILFTDIGETSTACDENVSTGLASNLRLTLLRTLRHTYIHTYLLTYILLHKVHNTYIGSTDGHNIR